MKAGKVLWGREEVKARIQFYVCSPSLPAGRVAREMGSYSPAPVCLGYGLWNGNLSHVCHTLDEEVAL